NFNERHQLDRKGNSATDGLARPSSQAAGMSYTDGSDWGTEDERRTLQEEPRVSVPCPQSPEAFRHARRQDVTSADRACTDVVDREKSREPALLRRCVRRT